MHSSLYNNNRPIYRPTVTHVRIANEGLGLSSNQDGLIDLYPSASRVFGVLDQNNVFTGMDNVFQHIQARHMHFVSDPRVKENVNRIESDDAIALVRCVEPYTYTIWDSGTSAGFMADMILPEYTRLTSSGLQTVPCSCHVHPRVGRRSAFGCRGNPFKTRQSQRETEQRRAENMSHTEECAAATMSNTVTLPEEAPTEPNPDNDIATCDRLYSELQTIIRNQNGTSEEKPRTFLSVHISSWLESARAWAFHPTTRSFTAWGGPVVKIARATLLEYEENAISPDLVWFIREVSAPAVFGNTTMDPIQQDIAHILMQCLVRPNALPSPTSSTISEGSRKRHRWS